MLTDGPKESGRRRSLRICLAASAGGHLTQLLRLSGSWKGYDIFYVTTTSVVVDKISGHGRVHVVGESNREHPLRTLKVLMKCIKVALTEKPDVIISTGAAAGCIMCFLGKLLGAKVIWLDSITNVEEMSLSGRMVRRVADLCLVQWPELVEKYEGVEYVGTVV